MDRGYFLDEFKKAKPPTSDGYLKKPEDAKASILGMKKFFELHNYTNNMKDRVAIFSLRGKSNIWGEDVKLVRDIRAEELSWHEFNRLFNKKYLTER